MDIIYEIRRRHLVQKQTITEIARDMGLTYYNHRRLHSTLDYISAMQFEKNWFVA